MSVLSCTPAAIPSVQAPTWSVTRSFQWNYDHGPLLRIDELPDRPTSRACSFLSWRLCSPLGVAAGPLLNARFVELYARLGYSLLTYKSVRSRAWHAHHAPVLGLIRPSDIACARRQAPLVVKNRRQSEPSFELSSTNSVGLPSAEPIDWREDVRRAREHVGKGQVLVVSVVGTSEVYHQPEELADDFALCARWAVEAGADMIEANLSCPNVHAGKDDTYLDPELASLVLQATRATIGHVPLTAKLGYYADLRTMHAVLGSISPFVSALTLINAIKQPVERPNGHPYFPGRPMAGVGGGAIRTLAHENVRAARQFMRESGRSIPIIAVGGVTEPHNVDEYLATGAALVEVATAAIWRPYLSCEYLNQPQ